MTVNIESVNEGASPTSAVVSWSSDKANPRYYVYQDGEFMFDTVRESAVFTLQDDQANLISVFDDPDTRPPTTKKSDGLIRFTDDGSSDTFLIETVNGSVAEVKQEIRRSTIDRIHSYRTPRIDDVDGQKFQVTSFKDSLQSIAVPITVTVVRIPDPPVVSATFDDTLKKLTFS